MAATFSPSGPAPLHALYVTAPAGTADLAAEELAACGVTDVKVERGGVGCVGTLEQAYRICLWSRVANRVLLEIAKFPAPTPEALYDGARTVDWHAHLGVDGTLAVDCTSTRSAITHTQFAALKTKDAVVDQFRERTGARPSVDTEQPDVRINLHLDRDVATLALDVAGGSLHRRGYRGAQGAAPLKENLAAAVLLRAGWQKLAMSRGEGDIGFVDPMCGSGSLAIEAALIAADVAPGLLRNEFGFLRWRGHDEAAWQRLLTEAAQRRAERRIDGFIFRAYDRDAAAVRAKRLSRRRIRCSARSSKRATSVGRPRS
jgi:23S rRNA (guanine2445-N2)-methyltransferase / 23S rRNA (guanine2069-N7)-methyltransferase